MTHATAVRDFLDGESVEAVAKRHKATQREVEEAIREHFGNTIVRADMLDAKLVDIAAAVNDHLP